MISVLTESTFTPPVFILGVERCGSTWLSNIFDSSPDVLFFMEPFADFANIFPGFPDRRLYIDKTAPFLENILKNNFDNLYAYKYPLFDSHTAAPFQKMISYWLLHGYDRSVRALTGRSTLKYIRYNLLNLNRAEIPSLNNPKNATSNIISVKELRLNFKTGLLRSFFPSAKFIVVIRDPLVQLNSVLKLFSQGSLYQLKHSLYALFEYIRQCGRFQKYEPVLESLNQESLFDRLVAYWFLNYSVLIEDLQKFNSEYSVVRHEDLCEHTEDIVSDLFSFVGCKYTNSTKQYIDQSSRASSSASSPLDTTRNSKTLYAEALRKVDHKMARKFFNAARMFWSVSPKEIGHYRESIETHVKQ
jgi:hypothetical protein